MTSRRPSGNAFQVIGPWAEKTRRPNVLGRYNQIMTVGGAEMLSTGAVECTSRLGSLALCSADTMLHHNCKFALHLLWDISIGADFTGAAGNLSRYPQDNRGKDGFLPQ